MTARRGCFRHVTVRFTNANLLICFMLWFHELKQCADYSSSYQLSYTCLMPTGADKFHLSLFVYYNRLTV